MKFLCFVAAVLMLPGSLWAAQNAVPSAGDVVSVPTQIWQIEANRSQRHILEQAARDMGLETSAAQIYAHQLATKIAHQIVGEMDKLPAIQRTLALRQLSSEKQKWQNILQRLNVDVRNPSQLAQVQLSLTEFSQSLQNKAYYESLQNVIYAFQNEMQHLQILAQNHHPENFIAVNKELTASSAELAADLNNTSLMVNLFMTGNENIQQARIFPVAPEIMFLGLCALVVWLATSMVGC